MIRLPAALVGWAALGALLAASHAHVYRLGLAAERSRWEARASQLALQRATAQAEARLRAEQIIHMAETRKRPV